MDGGDTCRESHFCVRKITRSFFWICFTIMICVYSYSHIRVREKVTSALAVFIWFLVIQIELEFGSILVTYFAIDLI